MANLIATRYVPPGTYIGQLLQAQPTDVPVDARIPCYIGRGSKLSRTKNLPIVRSFIAEKQLTFTSSPPYIAQLEHAANGDKNAARLYDADGVEVSRDAWNFVAVNGSYVQVQLRNDVYDSNRTYFLDYQSVSRTYKDPVAIPEIRRIIAVGSEVDQANYAESEDFVLRSSVTDSEAGDDNLAATGSFGAVLADAGNTGTAVAAMEAGASYTHKYNRLFDLNVTAVVAGAAASGNVTFVAGAAGLVDGMSVILNDGVAAQAHTFEFVQVAFADETYRHPVVYTPADALGVLATALSNAINASSIAITAVPAAGIVTLTHDRVSTAGNQAIVKSVPDVIATKVDLAGGVNHTVTVERVETQQAAGNDALPNVPLEAAMTKPTVVLTDGSAGAGATRYVVMDFGNGVQVRITDSEDADVGDQWTVRGFGPGFIEADDRYGNTNTYPTATATKTGTGTGTVSVNGAAFALVPVSNAKYKIQVTAVGGVAPNRTATLVGCRYVGGTYANFTWNLQEAVPASLTQTQDGITFTLAFGATNHVVGDTFEIDARAPAIFPEFKDNRIYDLTVATSTQDVGDQSGTITGSYVTDTPEGSFGTFTAKGKIGVDFGRISFPGNLIVYARNLERPTAIQALPLRYGAADTFQFSVSLQSEIDWSVTAQVTETVAQGSILTDLNGAITGTPGTKYIILAHTPTNVISVKTVPANTTVSFVHIANTPYVHFPTAPTTDLSVFYEHGGSEPAPGSTYYITTDSVRQSSQYNTPIFITNLQQGRDVLGPVEVGNHLYIMNELVFANGAPGAYYIQVRDTDNDGVYTITDFRAAITASEAPRRITDVTILSMSTALPDAMASNVRMADPFARRLRQLWVGMPVGTPIGEVDQSGSILYTAKATLQVYGNSPAHGTRAIVAPTNNTVTIKMDDGVDIDVTVDGSFVAGALAALVSSFQDPGATILRQFLSGFTTIETYGDIEDPRNLKLGGNDVIYFTEQGTGVYRIEEDVTVDRFASDYHLINNMTQKSYITRKVIATVDLAVTGIVVPSAQAGVGLVKGTVVTVLSDEVAKGTIGRYQDENGNERPIDPNADVVAFVDSSDPTLYHFYFAFFTRNSIKRTFGQFSVNSNSFGQAISGG